MTNRVAVKGKREGVGAYGKRSLRLRRDIFGQFKLSIYYLPNVYIKSLAWLKWVLCLGSPKADIKVPAKPVLTRKIWGRIQNQLFVISGCWQNLFLTVIELRFLFPG